jgi:dihydroorotase-like cyclic amidohydrolase
MVADMFKVPVYVVHVSCKETIPLLKYLAGQNVRLIAETTPAFLCGDARDMQSRDLKARAKIQPPIRFAEDNAALWQAVADGTITVIGTDSLPYSTAYKDSVGFWESRVGLNCQVPATLPLMITEGLNKGWVDWPRLAAVLSSNPAKLYGLYPRKGALQPGSDADILIVDPECGHVLSGKTCRGKTNYSIWEGKEVRGKVTTTVLRGKVVAEKGEIVLDERRGIHLVGEKPAGL